MLFRKTLYSFQAVFKKGLVPFNVSVFVREGSFKVGHTVLPSFTRWVKFVWVKPKTKFVLEVKILLLCKVKGIDTKYSSWLESIVVTKDVKTMFFVLIVADYAF